MTFAFKNIAITGTLKKMDRSTAFNKIWLEGGEPKDNMSKKVDILVVADEVKDYWSTKRRKAIEYGTTTISETEFYQIIGA